MARIALVTCRPGPEVSVDRDLPVLVRALREAGAEAESVYWDDERADWGGYDLAVLRSTWDYSWRAAEFLAWAERCGKATRLANPAEVVRWNADKRYLGDLAEAGVPVVPTRYFAPGGTPSAADLPSTTSTSSSPHPAPAPASPPGTRPTSTTRPYGTSHACTPRGSRRWCSRT